MAGIKTHEYDATTYWKEQHFQTSTRLHLQHWIFNHQLGYTLHHSIPSSPDTPLRVADIACGNGAWILDTALSHPSHTYTGFDITPVHFPHASWLPANVSLHTWDVFTTVPQEFVGVFDVVHIRAFTSCIIANAVQPVISQIKKLVKPGGYLQWDENDPSTLSAQTPEGIEGKTTQTIISLQQIFSAQSQMSSDWLHALPSTLSSSGFSVVAEEKVSPKPALARAWGDNMLNVWLGLLGMLPEQEMPLAPVSGLPEKFSKGLFAGWVREAAKESVEGVRVGMEQVVVVARLEG